MDGDLDLRLVLRFVGPRRDDDGPVVARHFFVGALDLGLVAARLGHRALEVVGNVDLGRAAEEFQRIRVRADPARELLVGNRLDVGVAARTENGGEQLDLGDLAREWVYERGLHAREVEEHLLPGLVDLAHREPTP